MRITNRVMLVSALATLELPAQRTPAATGSPVIALAATGTPSTATLTWQSPAGVTGFDDPGPIETGAVQWPAAILNVVAA